MGRRGGWVIKNDTVDRSPWITSEEEKVLHTELCEGCHLCLSKLLFLTTWKDSSRWITAGGSQG